MILITSYLNPDLDGTACAFAYAELLQKNRTDVGYGLFGVIHTEAQFVFNEFNIPYPQRAEEIIQADSQIILVDASDTNGISPMINPDQIIEIVDHRAVHEAHKFINAKVQIELVGSAATLIAEKFQAAKIKPSQQAAALLYSAIVSNTVNFQANVTTERDKIMAQWLLNDLDLPDNYIYKMFKHKSTFKESLKDVIDHDFASMEFGGKKYGCAQLEIVDVEKLVTEQKEELLSILRELQEREKLDYNFLTAVDVMEATNTFVAGDVESIQLVEKALGVTFEHNIARRKGIMMRKTITPFIKKVLEDRLDQNLHK